MFWTGGPSFGCLNLFDTHPIGIGRSPQQENEFLKNVGQYLADVPDVVLTDR